MAEQQNTIAALQKALRLEIDGKDFYSRAAQDASSEFGRRLLSTLAAEEDYHRRVFSAIYDAIRDKNKWPDLPLHLDDGNKLKTLFAKTIEQAGNAQALKSELDAVNTARAMETTTYDFYQEQKKLAQDPVELEFYDKLAAQEQQHNLALADYYEYLQNPAAWFVKKEHPTLD